MLLGELTQGWDAELHCRQAVCMERTRAAAVIDWKAAIKLSQTLGAA